MMLVDSSERGYQTQPRDNVSQLVCVCVALGWPIISADVQDVVSKIMLKECTIFNDV